MSPRRRRTERGFTLVEVMITSVLMVVVLAIVLPQLTGSLTTFDHAQVRSDTTDQAQVALGQIEHDVRGSNVLYLDNTLPNGTGIVHLQTFGTAGAATCVEYETVGRDLLRRTKAPSATWPAAAVGWTYVISGIVNTSSQAVFAVPSTSQYRSLSVTLWINTDTRTSQAAAPAQYTTTITGRAIPANQSSASGAC